MKEQIFRQPETKEEEKTSVFPALAGDRQNSSSC
jgi:hypothetical protein